jgi:hypothetical protein
MTILFDSNLAPANGAALLYAIKARLKLAGWTVMASGDGLSAYGAASDVITNNGAGANGINQQRAWFRIKMPGATREFVFQRGTNATDLRLKYSVLGFSTGSPSATQAPTASDEQILIAGGTDATPTGTNYVGTINKCQIWADNASPYGWGVHGWSAAGANTFMLVMDALLSGTYPAEDVDPYVFWLFPNSSSFTNFTTICAVTNTGISGWLAKGLAGAGFTTFTAGTFSIASASALNAGSQLPVNPHNGKDDDFPFSYFRISTQIAPTGWKGYSRYLKMTAVIRANLATHTVTTTKDRVVFSNGTTGLTGPNGGVDVVL